MKKFFYPNSVAVVGVSENPFNLGQGIIYNLLKFGFPGPIYPIGPKGGQIQGLKILTSLLDLPGPVDLVTILAPAPVIPNLLDDCGQLGIKRVIVESAGFSEYSDTGRSLENEVRTRISQYGLRLIGPNGLGVINQEIGLALPFASIPHRPAMGNVSLVCQSGGVGTNLISWLAQTGLGLNKFISLGNKLNVQENEILDYLLEDEGTHIICLYLEGITDGRGLMEVGRSAGKPILLLKGNLGGSSAAIAQSHTASLAGDDRVAEAACAQAGIFRISTQREMLLAATALQQPPLRGNRLAVLSRSGGEAVIIADCCQKWGFELPALSPDIKSLIKKRSRAGVIQPINPIDLGDVFDFPLYEEIMAAFCHDPQYDAILLTYGPVAEPEREAAHRMAKTLIDLAQQFHKPLAIAVIVNLEELDFFRQTLRVPVFTFPEEAIQALASARDWHNRAIPPSPPLPAEVPDLNLTTLEDLLVPHREDSGPLPLPLALEVIRQAGIPVADWRRVNSADAARAAADGLGYPVCLKLVAPSAVHKSDLGGVLLHLDTPGAVIQGFLQLEQVVATRLPAGEVWEVVVMPQIEGGIEVLAGAKRDATFGPVIMVGAGGIWVEFLQDVAMGIAPLDQAAARRLIDQTRIRALLQGRRGQPPADITGLAQSLLRLSTLMLHFPDIQEVDINPLRVFPAGHGTLALDARIIIGDTYAKD